jgi:ATP synthase protein I
MPAVRFFYVVRWVLLAQITTSLVAGVAGWIIADRTSGISAGLGGVIALLPNCYFAYLFGRRDDRRTAREVVSSLYAGETVKLILTVVLFAVVLQFGWVQLLPLIGGYAVTLTVFWFALLVHGVNL